MFLREAKPFGPGPVMSIEMIRRRRALRRPAYRLNGLLRYLAAIRSQWDVFKPLVRRAFRQLRYAKGTRSKLAVARRLAPKAYAWLTHHTALEAARSSLKGSTNLADYIDPPLRVPECVALGGGILAVSLPSVSATAARVRISNRYGMTYSCRQLDRIERTHHHAPLASPDGSLSAGDAVPLASVQLVVQAPSELCENMAGKIDVYVEGGTEPVVFKDMVLENSSAVSVTNLSIENNLLQFSGSVARQGLTDLNLGLFVDGTLAGSSIFPLSGRRLFGSVLIDDRFLDGAGHLLELRELPGMALAASSYELLPLHITPWQALQTYARAPLDGTLSPSARHHFRSYKLWLDTLSEGRQNLPPIARLHGELLQGFKKRTDYPALDFPQYADPVASIVIPAHDKFEVTYLCLCSLLFAFNDANFEVIVVDDGSSDETRDIGRFVRGIRVIRHETAMGFVDACNDGARLARGEFVAFLNNDTEATARWLDELIAAIRNFANIGMVGSKLVYPDGRLQEAGGIIWGSANPWNVGRGGNANAPQYNYLRSVDYLSGAALMLPRKIWEQVGGFSPEYAPGYFEDTDLAMKVRGAGYRVLYVPTSTIIHYEGQSAGTDTAGSGMKRFQEVNRPKFHRKWAAAVAHHGLEGERPDREKDRAALRVLFIDHQFPFVDSDAGSYAAFQEIRLLQALGAKVTFLPRNLAFMDRHTLALQRIGVECLYAPYIMNFVDYVRSRAGEYDAVFVCRYYIAEQVVPVVRAASPNTKIILNLADLHFLREMREAAAGTEGYTRERAEATRTAELSVVQASDLTFSYTDVELAILEQNLARPAVTARLPWVVEAKPLKRSFQDSKDILFFGSFNHPPNLVAVRFFAREILPALRRRIPGVRFSVAGSGSDKALRDLSCDGLQVLGHVPDLDEVLARARIFVAPLLSGAGLKGKVIDAISRGLPCVISPIAAEGTGLVDGVNCLIADGVERWTDAVLQLYADEALWTEIGQNALKLAITRYGFANALNDFEQAIAKIGIVGRREGAVVYEHTRPERYGF
jgi:GT2 family glycosyltransferase/glycosyltransferase involved in cell wall biosynthesis